MEAVGVDDGRGKKKQEGETLGGSVGEHEGERQRESDQ